MEYLYCILSFRCTYVLFSRVVKPIARDQRAPFVELAWKTMDFGFEGDYRYLHRYTQASRRPLDNWNTRYSNRSTDALGRTLAGPRHLTHTPWTIILERMDD